MEVVKKSFDKSPFHSCVQARLQITNAFKITQKVHEDVLNDKNFNDNLSFKINIFY